MNSARRFATFARAWDSLGHIGTDRARGSAVRYITGTNHFLALTAVCSLPWALVFVLWRHPPLVLPALTQCGMIGALLGCLALTKGGASRLASILGLVAPLIQFTWLATQFSSRSGFQLPLLSAAGVAFVVLRPALRWWRVAVTLAATSAVLWTFLDESFAAPAMALPESTLRWFLAGNVLLAMALASLTAVLNDYYFARERHRADLLLMQAEMAAKTDSLTGVVNRRGVAPMLASAAREGDYAVALADLDRFKRINDSLGHGAGDVVLSSVARSLVLAIGDDGTVARWGGEEFLIVLPGVTALRAISIIERARAAVERDFGADGVMEHVTISAGVAHVPQGTSKETALRRADKLLYEAKHAGRNCVRAVSLVASGA